MRVGCGRDSLLARFVPALLLALVSIALMIPRGEVALGQTSMPPITKLFYATDLQVLGTTEQEIFHFSLPANTLGEVASLAVHVKMVGFLTNGDGGGVRIRGYIGGVEIWDTGDQYIYTYIPNPAWNFDWRSNVQKLLGIGPVWSNNVQAVLGVNYFGYGTDFYVNAGNTWAGAGYRLQSTVDWTFDQVVRVTVQGTGINEGWEGYVIATLEGQ